MANSRRVAIATVDDVPEGGARVFEISDEFIALCRVAGRFWAIEDRCTHDDGPLGDGLIAGYEIECPRHGARFDVRDGAVCRQPAFGPLTIYDVTVENGFVFIDLPGRRAESADGERG